MPREAKCAEGGHVFSCSDHGRRPKYCPAHLPRKAGGNRKRQAQRAMVAGYGDELSRLIAGVAGDEDQARAIAWAPLLYAAALCATSDPSRARIMAGLPDGMDLVALEAQARDEYSELIAMSAAGMQRLGWVLAVQALARLAPQMAVIPSGQLASSLKAIVDALERLQTAVRPTFGSVEITWDFGPQADDQ